MFRRMIYGLSLILACASAPAVAVPLGASFTANTDDAGGRSFAADFHVSPGKNFTLTAGAGHSQGSDETADLTGTLLDAGVSWHPKRGGLSLSADSFDDSSNYQARTLAARGWLAAGDFEIALLARQRNLSVDLTLQLPLRTARRTADFSALGAGLELSWSHDDTNAYLNGIVYDYDDGFDRFIELSRSPQLSRRPRIEALVGTVLTQAQGVIDRQIGVGVEHAFGRHSLALDLSSVHDAILGTDSTSLSLTWRYAQSARLDWSVSGGVADSETYGDIGFIGIGLGIGD